MIAPAYALKFPDHVISVGLLSTVAGRSEEDNQKVRNVLFDYKIKTKFGKSMKFERKELFKYKRTTNLSEWQKIPKESTKDYKQ